jgi:hypothetical protein
MKKQKKNTRKIVVFIIADIARARGKIEKGVSVG